MIEKLDLTKDLKPNFELEDSIREGQALEVDFRKLCGALSKVQEKINEVIENLNKGGGEK